ncbi:MAG: hypothetical protein GY721_14625 [Deltaproteobacteria bacterium]|nr:hypothetical protein [Deltaproteobacteria bacterium]
MAVEMIGAKLGSMDEPVKVEFDVPETIEAAVAQFKEEVVFSRFRAQIIVDLQAYMRSLIKAEKTPDEIQEAVNAWEPGVKQKGKSPSEKARDMFSKLSDEDRAALLEDLGLN